MEGILNRLYFSDKLRNKIKIINFLFYHYKIKSLSRGYASLLCIILIEVYVMAKQILIGFRESNIFIQNLLITLFTNKDKNHK